MKQAFDLNKTEMSEALFLCHLDFLEVFEVPFNALGVTAHDHPLRGTVRFGQAGRYHHPYPHGFVLRRRLEGLRYSHVYKARFVLLKPRCGIPSSTPLSGASVLAGTPGQVHGSDTTVTAHDHLPPRYCPL